MSELGVDTKIFIDLIRQIEVLKLQVDVIDAKVRKVSISKSRNIPPEAEKKSEERSYLKLRKTHNETMEELENAENNVRESTGGAS